MKSFTKILFLAFLGLNFIYPQAVLADYNENEVYIDPYRNEIKENVPALLKAVKQNDLKEVKTLIKNGADVNEMEYCDTALTSALYRCNLDIIKELIKAGANVNAEIDCSSIKTTITIEPMDIALESCKDSVEILLKAGVNEEIKNKALLTASQTQDSLPVANILLKYGAKDTPLAALYRNDIEKFNTLLKNTTLEEKNEALLEAVKKNNITVVKELIKSGADVNTPYFPQKYSTRKELPLTIALNNNFKELSDFLKENGAKENIFSAVKSQDLQRVKQAIKDGANPNEEIKDICCYACACDNFYGPLADAAKYGNLEIVKELLKAGANPNPVQDDEHITPLFQAVDENHLETVKELIKAGADVNAYSGIEGTTLSARALDYAKNEEIKKLLKQHGAKISDEIYEEKAEETYTKEDLFKAIENNDLKQVKKLISAGADVNATRNDDDGCEECEYEHISSILSEAVNKGNAEIVKELLKAGADPNGLEMNDCDVCYYDTLLEVAARNGNLEIVKELIKAGADPNGSKKKYKDENPYYNNPLVAAAGKGYLEIVKEFLKIGPNVGLSEALYEASDGGYTEIVKELIKAGADVNYKDEYGYTPLSVAKKNGHNETALLLKEHEAKNTLFAAIDNNDLEEVKILIKEGANLEEIRKLPPRTVLMRAIEKENLNIVKTLIKAGANVNNSYDSYYPLRVAIEHKNLEIVKLLIKNGANVNAKDKYNARTALMTAVSNNSPEIVKLLIKNGANINAKDDVDGETALMHAVFYGNSEIVRLLIERGADVNLRDKYARTALMQARERGNTEIIDLLKAARAKE